MKTNPISAVFAAGVAIRNTLYDRGVFKARKLSRPVVSVGNLSVGGSGKTPFVIALGMLLKDRGIEFDILSRGYGRQSAEVAVVDPEGSPAQFGDEPLLIARKLKAPVIVGADRYQAGLLAEQRFRSQLHLLDDGFQHRRLHRDYDIVMVPGSDLEDTPLPIGRLREPLASLRRADAVVSDRGASAAPQPAGSETGASSAPEILQQLAQRIQQALQGGGSVSASLHVLPLEIWRMKRNVYLEETTKKPLAFCGIARPGQFYEHLHGLGIELAGAVSFPDHHRYTEQDVARLSRAKSAAGADGFLTTEKDAINLGALAGRLQPLNVARLRLVLEDPERALSSLLGTLERRCGCRF
jgi:tetraacyldisaccharide 4'-kinase